MSANKESISVHRGEKIKRVVKFIVHMHITTQVKAYWLNFFKKNPPH